MVSKPDKDIVWNVTMIVTAIVGMLLMFVLSDEVVFVYIALFVFLMGIRGTIVRGRTLIMDDVGCTVCFLWYRKGYRWDELQIKRIDHRIMDISKGFEPYKSAAVFSPHNIHKPEKMDPGEYCFLFHPLSVFFVYFIPEMDGYYDKTNFEKWKASNEYAVDERLFREKMKIWGVELSENNC